MHLITQQTKSSCGQTCIAMICGLKWEEAVALVGHKHSTRTRELVAVLRAQGKDVEDHLTVIHGRPLPGKGTYILKLKYSTTGSHWVVLHDGNVYDPAHGLNPVLQDGWRFTSYLKIR